MKVIDLLNKIVNGEEVPEKIKYRNKIFIYDKDNLCYVVENYNEYDDLLISLSNHKGTDLNYEVEIIEEKENNKIEKLEIVNNGSLNSYALLNEYGTKCGLTKHSKIMCDKINELIDVINELRGKDEN